MQIKEKLPKDALAPEGFRDPERTRLAAKLIELNAYNIHAPCLGVGSVSKLHCFAEY